MTPFTKEIYFRKCNVQNNYFDILGDDEEDMNEI